MRYFHLLLVLSSSIAIGCNSQTADTVDAPAVEVKAAGEGDDVTTSSMAGNDEMVMTPENTLIQFVGTHVGPTPDPKARTGKFGDFSGKAIMADEQLKSVSVDIQIASVDTGMEKLNNHLQAEDFFSVREYPTAKFESTKIEPGENGEHNVTGALTLHSKTNEISFPASIEMTDGSLNFSGKLTLDRTEFGMDQNTEKVNKEVDLTITIGNAAG